MTKKILKKTDKSKKEKLVPVDFAYRLSPLGRAIMAVNANDESDKAWEDMYVTFLDQVFWVPMYVVAYDKIGKDVIKPMLYYLDDLELFSFFEQPSRFLLFRYKKELRNENGVFLRPITGAEFFLAFPLKDYKDKDIIIDYGRVDKMRFLFTYDRLYYLIRECRKGYLSLEKKTKE